MSDHYPWVKYKGLHHDIELNRQGQTLRVHAISMAIKNHEVLLALDCIVYDATNAAYDVAADPGTGGIPT